MVGVLRMKFTIYLVAFVILNICTSGFSTAAVYKCKSSDGAVVYTALPCKEESAGKQLLTPQNNDSETQTYLRFSDSTYTYKGFYDKFRCGSISGGLSLFPGKNTVSTLMREIILEQKSPVHNLKRHTANYGENPNSSAGKVCYIGTEKRPNRTTLNFGIGSFSRNDLSNWNAQKIAQRLARLGYEFNNLNNDYKKFYSYKWRNADFRCSLTINDDSDKSNPYINVSARCSGSIK